MDITSHPPTHVRRLSRAIAILMAVFFWLMASGLWLGAVAILFLLPHLGPVAEIWDHYSSLPFSDLFWPRRLALALDLIFWGTPSLFVLYHMQRLFSRFSGGLIFTEANIGTIRALGLWLIVLAVVANLAQIVFLWIAEVRHAGDVFNLSLTPLFYGAITFVVAYVMAEAHRAADENASIV